MADFAGVILAVELTTQNIQGMADGSKREKLPGNSEIQAGSDQEYHQRESPGEINGG
jgi:hypothetical protein